MKSEYRPCPVCEHGRVVIAELQKGSRCSYCHRLIETDFVYAAGIPTLGGLLSILAFRNDFGVVGLLLTGFMIFYTAGYDSVVAKYIPLKHYGDSD